MSFGRRFEVHTRGWAGRDYCDLMEVLNANTECTSLSCSSSAANASLSSSICSNSGEGDSFSDPSSVLSSLRAPRPSDLSCKWAIRRNPPPKGKRRARGCGANEPKSVTPRQRVSEHPDEYLTVSNKRLFCRACREELSLVSSVINNHLKSGKHKEWVARNREETDIVEALVSSDKNVHPVGETLPQDQRVYRIKVFKAFLQAGVPLSKLASFRDILEENAFRLSDRSHMSDAIPFIASQEQANIKDELHGKDISIIFDGTTRMGEAMGIVVRYVSSEWEIKQRLVRLQLLAQSMSGDEVAREIITTLSVIYSINPTSVLATMRDRAAVNNVALRTLSVVYPMLFLSYGVHNGGLGSVYSAIARRLVSCGGNKQADQLQVIPRQDGGAGGRS